MDNIDVLSGYGVVVTTWLHLEAV